MIRGVTRRTVKNKITTNIKIKFYITMADPLLLYSTEIWIMTKKTDNKVTAF